MKTILSEFSAKRDLYASLGATSKDLLSRLLGNLGLQIHHITYRVKTLSSLSGKIEKSDDKYNKLGDITDLVGVRITTYFEEDVDRVAELIEEQFSVDQDNSTDKRKSLDSDQFGYQSLHFVVSLSEARLALDEYRNFQGLKLEFQVRSILQHAWAEIEHDLGYKAVGEVPREIKRRFARVAGLLEVADSEFTALRKELRSYEDSVPEKISNDPSQVGIDLISLGSAYDRIEAFAELDKAVAARACAEITKHDRDFISRAVARLQFFEIESIEELTDLVSTNHKQVSMLAERWFDGKIHRHLNQGIGIFYLAYWMAARTGDVNLVHGYLLKANIGGDTDRMEVAERIVRICQEIKNESA